MLMNYAATGLVWAPLIYTHRIKYLMLYTQIVIKISNVAISCCCFTEDGTEARLFFFLLTNPISKFVVVVAGDVVDA